MTTQTTTATTTQTKVRTTRKAKAKAKGKQSDVVQTSPPCEAASNLSYPPQAPSTIEALRCNPEVQQKGWIMTLKGVTINPLSSTRRQAGVEYFLLDTGAQLHACPIKYPGQRVPLPNPGITQRMELASNMTQDVW